MNEPAPTTSTAPDAPTTPSETFSTNVPGNGSDGGKRCRSCGTVNPADADACLNTTCRKFLPANASARTHGIYARHQPADLEMSANELVDGIVSDLGGLDNMSTLERSGAQKLRDLEIKIRLLAGDIARNGIMTPGGRVRDVDDRHIANVLAFVKLADKLGWKRRARHIDLARALSGMDK